jgi:hypothetical protein
MESPMKTHCVLVLLLSVTAPPAVLAQTPIQFRWQKGAVLSYKVKTVTAVTEVVSGGKQQFGSRLDLTKRYRVVDVDTGGTATLEYSVTAMRNEQTRPNGEVLLYDSADLAKSTPGLREQLGKFVGTTLAVLRVDPTGAVVEVKQGPPGRYTAEPLFTLVLPKFPVQAGKEWTRPFDLKLDPPLGTGEKYAAKQECRCTKLEGGKATIALATSFKPLPESVQERMPLVQKETQGRVVFDIAAGRVAEVRLTVDRTLDNHQGPGSSYHFESSYSEQYTAD